MRNKAVILTKSCNDQLCMYVLIESERGATCKLFLGGLLWKGLSTYWSATKHNWQLDLQH